MIRVVADQASGLEQMHMHELRVGIADPSLSYNPVDAEEEYSGSRSLILDRPYHRAIFRLLLRRAEKLGSIPSAAVRDFRIDGQCREPSFDRDAMGRWLVPTQGVANFFFLVRAPTDESWGASQAVREWHRKRRVPVSFIRFLALVRLWMQQELAEDKTRFLRALTRDLCFKMAQVKYFVQETAAASPALVPDILVQLSATMESADRAMVLSCLRLARLVRGELPMPGVAVWSGRVLREMDSLLCLNVDNPTNHYCFNLHLPPDYAAADRLFVAIRWEAGIAKERQLLDTSELGDYLGIRNFTTDGNAIRFCISFLPGDGHIGVGHIAFDYVTPLARPQRKKGEIEPLDYFRFEKLLGLVQGEGGSPCEAARLQTLCLVAHRLYLTAWHLREILEPLAPGQRARDLYVVLFPRCVDFGAPLNDRAQGVLACPKLFPSRRDYEELRSRLGMCNVLDAASIHDLSYREFAFDLSRRDERICLTLLLRCSKVEKGQTFQDCNWTGLSAQCETGYWTIPGKWYQAIPEIGILTLTYVCQERSVSLKVRHELARDMLGWVMAEP